MSSGIINYPKFKAFDTNGAPLAGGLLYAYGMGTTTPKNTYTSVGLSVPNTNPVVLNSLGEAVVFGSGTYKLVLADSDGVTIWTFDGVEFAAAGASKVSGADTTAGFLENKLVAGANIALTKLNAGANETFRIAVTGVILTSAIGVTVQAYDADTMKSDTVTARTRAHHFTPVAVSSSGGALALDCDLHEEVTITLTENTTVSAPSNRAAGKYLVLHVTGASAYTLGWNAVFKGAPSTAAVGAGKRKSFCFQCKDGTDLYFIGATEEV